MNVLIINGGPKKAGLTSQMLEIMREELINSDYKRCVKAARKLKD